MFIASNRELRAVPFTWQHPLDATGEPIPLPRRDFLYTEQEIADLLAEGRTREEIEAEFMPDFSGVPAEQMGVTVYETTTEGTPLTPAFPDTHEGLLQLLQYCAQHCTTFADIQAGLDEWARILGLQYILSATPASWRSLTAEGEIQSCPCPIATSVATRGSLR